MPFEEVIADVSGGNVKTLQGEFLSEGRFAIVDQGKEWISGYTNEEKDFAMQIFRLSYLEIIHVASNT